MKTTKFLLMSLCAALIMSGAVSCSKDDSGYSLGRVWRSVVTVDPIGKGGTYSLTLDDGTRLWPAGTEIPFYRPTTRHRALAYYRSSPTPSKATTTPSLCVASVTSSRNRS